MAQGKKGRSNVRRGKTIEGMVEEVLRDQGYIIWRTIRVKYRNIDIFGLFDVVGLAADGSHILWIQAKRNSCGNEIRDRISLLKMPPGNRKEIWIWKDTSKSWRKEYYD